jgi:hypothetical protein
VKKAQHDAILDFLRKTQYQFKDPELVELIKRRQVEQALLRLRSLAGNGDTINYKEARRLDAASKNSLLDGALAQMALGFVEQTMSRPA